MSLWELMQKWKRYAAINSSPSAKAAQLACCQELEQWAREKDKEYRMEQLGQDHIVGYLFSSNVLNDLGVPEEKQFCVKKKR